MPTIAIVSQKGGSGKTTIAIHLAAAAVRAGKIACIIDTDPQATAAAWGDWRGGSEPEVITTPPARLAKTIEDAAKLGAVLRQQTQMLKPLPKADYDALRAAFDAKAAHLIEETVNADAE